MTTDLYLAALKRRWAAFLFFLVIGIGGGAYHLETTTKLYDSSVRVFVNVPTTGGVQQSLNGVTLSLQLLQSYARIATSEATTEAIRKRLVLDPGQALDGSITATVEPNTLVLRMTARSPSPDRARGLAEASAPALDSVLQSLSSDPNSQASIRVLDPAKTPRSPSSPSAPHSLVVGLVLGLLSGFGAVAVLEAFDRSIRTLGVGRSILGVPGMAVIPNRRQLGRAPVSADPHDAVVEAFRALRTAIRFPDREPPVHSVLVTSAQAGEGKSTVASNLAVILAQAGERVCLIDADLRRSSIPRMFGLASSPGLTSVVLGDALLADAIVESNGVSVLPMGPHQANPSELLGSESFAILLESLTASFDVVILDAPPVLPVTDAVVLATQVDAVLIVTRQGRTRQGDAAKTRDLLAVVSANTIGFVLNAAKGGFSDYRYQTYELQDGETAPRNAVRERGRERFGR